MKNSQNYGEKINMFVKHLRVAYCNEMIMFRVTFGETGEERGRGGDKMMSIAFYLLMGRQ